jgi:cytoskeletal protein CcmA (bactofilin family)
MISILAPVALTISTGALLTLPLAPALRELTSKRDANPLITRRDNGKIDNFAANLRTRAEPFLPHLIRAAEQDRIERLDLPEGPILVVGKTGRWGAECKTSVFVLSAGPVDLPDGFHSLEDFYARGSVQSGRNNLFRALLSDTDLVLGGRTQILRWLHAQGSVVAEEDCALFGRASAGRSMTLAPKCRFERVHSPVIYSSRTARLVSVRTESAPFSKLAQAGLGRARVHGNVRLQPGEQRYGNLVASESLEVQEGARVFGSVKANGDIRLQERAEVDGSLVSTKRIHIGSACFVKGPIIAEREIWIGSGVQVGLPGSPATVSAPRIHIAAGSVLHGTVWARAEGRVET